MLQEIAVDGKAVLVLAQMHPIGFDVDRPVTLLQEDDVRNHICTGVGLERIVGQPDGTQQLCPLGDVLADLRGLLVHSVAGGYKGDDAAGPHLIQRLGEKVIVNGKTELVISPVVDLILSKGYVADSEVKEIPAVGGLKACHGNVGLGIELLGDTACDAVQLHAVQAAATHFLRQQAEEVAHAHGRLQNIAGLEAHVAYCLINGLDNGGAGVVGVQRGASGGSIFLRGEGCVQFLVFLCPGGLALVKGIGQAAPAHIPGKDFLLCRCRLPTLCFQGFQKVDGVQIGTELGFGASDAQIVIGDTEVFSRRDRLLRNRFCVGHDLMDEGIAVQGFGIDHFPIHNAPLGKGLPDGDRVHVLHAVLLLRREEAVLFDELGNPPLNLGPGQIHGSALRRHRKSGKIVSVLPFQPCGGVLLPPVLGHIANHRPFAVHIAVPFLQSGVDLSLGNLSFHWMNRSRKGVPRTGHRNAAQSGIALFQRFKLCFFRIREIAVFGNQGSQALLDGAPLERCLIAWVIVLQSQPFGRIVGKPRCAVQKVMAVTTPAVFLFEKVNRRLTIRLVLVQGIDSQLSVLNPGTVPQYFIHIRLGKRKSGRCLCHTFRFRNILDLFCL